MYNSINNYIRNSCLFTLVGVMTLSYHNCMNYKINNMYIKTLKGENLAVFVRLCDLVMIQVPYTIRKLKCESFVSINSIVNVIQ